MARARRTHGREEMYTEYWWENQSVGDLWEDLSIGGTIILKLISKK
jgi:hypothetical protein